MAWKKVKIKDIFDFEKGPLQSSKNTPGEYDFITAGSNRKTHNTFSHEGEYLIFAMAASGSLGRTHYVNGKFISSDLCFIMTPKNPDKINMRFYHIYFNLIRKDIVSKTATGSAKIAINQNNFGNYEIISGNIEDQNSIFDKINLLAPNIEKLLNIFDDQTLVKRLRQSILQDAIQGKLISQDPNDETASELIKKIESEKEQLIKDKKIKKGKNLAPIIQDEEPFVLPKGWDWVRFDNLCNIITQGPNPKYNGIESNEYYVLKTKDFYNNIIHYRKLESISKELFEEFRRYQLINGDIIIGLVGVGSTGKCNIFYEQKNQNIIFTRATGLIRLDHKFTNNKYIKYLLSSTYGKETLDKITDGSTGQLVIKTSSIKNILIPLPPLEEQHRIVAKVDELMGFCDNLEKQISEAKENGERLMESVLGEVFK